MSAGQQGPDTDLCVMWNCVEWRRAAFLGTCVLIVRVLANWCPGNYV